MTEPKWKRFERLIHQIHQQFGKDNVTLDEYLPGHDSKTDRQIDVVIRGVVNQYTILVIVECRDKARPTDVGEVEAFVGVVRDVRANKGVMISRISILPRDHPTGRAVLLDPDGIGCRSGRLSLPEREIPSPNAVFRRGSVQTTLLCAVRSVRPSAPCVKESTPDVLDDSSAGVLSA